MFRCKREKAISLILVIALIISFFNVPFGGIKSVHAEENDSFSMSVLARLQDEKYVSSFDYQKAYYDKGGAAIIILQIYPALPKGYTIKLANEQVGQMFWGCDSCKATSLSDSKYYPTSAYPLTDEDRDITEVELRGYTSFPLDDFTRDGMLSVDVVKLSDTSESPASYGHIDIAISYCNSEIKHTVTFLSDDENGYVYKDDNGNEYSSYEFTYSDGETISLDDNLVDYSGTPYKVVTGWKLMDENGSFDGGDIYGDDWNRKSWNKELYRVEVTEDMTFKAIWEDGAKITYDTNEEEGGYISTPGIGKVTQYTQKVLKDSDIWLNGNINNNDNKKIFKGWRSSIDNELYGKYDQYFAKENVTFTAEFVDGITVTFDANGGYFVYHSNSEYYIAKGETLEVVPDVKNAGKVLIGWKDSKGKEYTNDSIRNVKLNEDITFSAIWQTAYDTKIILHSNYPEAIHEEDTELECETDEGRFFLTGLGIYDDYINESWHTSDGKTYENNEYFIPSSKETVDLYADWRKYDTYTITYHSNYPKEWNMEEKTYEEYKEDYNGFYPEIGKFEGKEGFVPTKWFYYEDGVAIEVSLDQYIQPKKDMDFYAVWEESDDYYCLRVNSNYPEESKLENQTNINYIRKDYSFIGEYYLATFDGDFEYPEGYKLCGWKDSKGKSYDRGFETEITEDTEFYAQWEEKEKVVLHANYPEGIEGENIGYAYIDDDQVFLGGPYEYGFKTANGVEFIGWSLTESGGEILSPDSYYQLEDGAEVYAQWNITGERYKITLHSNRAGETEEETKEIYTDYVGCFIADENTFEGENGQRIVGWSTSPESSDCYFDINSSTAGENMDLYAVWGTQTLITYLSAYPEGLASENVKEKCFTDSEGYLIVSDRFGYYGYNIDYYVDSKGNRYEIDKEYHFEQDTELTTVWKEAKAITYYNSYPNGDIDGPYSLYEEGEGYYYLPSSQLTVDDIEYYLSYYETEDGKKYYSDQRYIFDEGTKLYAHYVKIGIEKTIVLHSNYPDDWNLEQKDVEIKTSDTQIVLSNYLDQFTSCYGASIDGFTTDDGVKLDIGGFAPEGDMNLYVSWLIPDTYLVSFLPTDDYTISFNDEQYAEGYSKYVSTGETIGYLTGLTAVANESGKPNANIWIDQKDGTEYDFDDIASLIIMSDRSFIPGFDSSKCSHEWDEGTETSTPTCTDMGEMMYTCTKCGKTYFEEIPAWGHTMEHMAYVAATCTTEGNSEYWSCDNCNKYFSDAEGENEIAENSWVIDATGHNMAHYEAAEPTCTTDGNSEYWYCDQCDKYFSDAEGINEIEENSWVIDAAGHNMTHYEAAEPTCTTEGNSEYWYCDQCNKYFSDAEGENEIAENSWVIDATGHNMTHYEAAEPTCTTDGNSEYWYCDQCNKYFSDAEGENEIAENSWVIDAAGHNMTHYEAAEPTCTTDGNSEYWSCNQCNKYFSDAEGENEIAEDSWIIPAAGHNMTHYEAVSETCTEAGNGEYWSCDQCNKYFSDAEGENEIAENSWVIDAAGHNMTHYEAVSETCTEAGNGEYWSCNNCNKYFSDAEGENEIAENSWVIDATGHNMTHYEAAEPTCTTDGNSEYWYCDQCDKYFSDAEGENEIAENSWIIPAGHKLTFHVAVPETCTEDGNSAYWSCDNCNKYFSDAAGENEIAENSWVIDATGHKLTKQNKKAATCTADGNNEYWSCDNCDKCFSDEEGLTEIEKESCLIPATGHTVVVDKAVAATTTSTGLTEGSHCSVCGTVIKKQQTIPKLQTKTTDPQPDKGQQPEPDKTQKQPEKKYSSEWVNGKWYNADGTQTYEGTIIWKSNSTGWWIEDTAGWYPTSSWQKIDGAWYYFKADGYMAESEYYNGYWFNSDGTMDETYYLTWKSNSTGWWVEDKSGWWPSSQWLKIDGSWYYFDGSGYMVTSQYVDGYWIGANGVCQ